MEVYLLALAENQLQDLLYQIVLGSNLLLLKTFSVRREAYDGFFITDVYSNIV